MIRQTFSLAEYFPITKKFAQGISTAAARNSQAINQEKLTAPTYFAI
jgi:hypothetical protein